MVQSQIYNGVCSVGVLLLLQSGRQMLILPGQLSAGQAGLRSLSIYIQLISLPIKVMKQSAVAFISLPPTAISFLDEMREQRTTTTGRD